MYSITFLKWRKMIFNLTEENISYPYSTTAELMAEKKRDQNVTLPKHVDGDCFPLVVLLDIYPEFTFSKKTDRIVPE